MARVSRETKRLYKALQLATPSARRAYYERKQKKIEQILRVALALQESLEQTQSAIQDNLQSKARGKVSPELDAMRRDLQRLTLLYKQTTKELQQEQEEEDAVRTDEQSGSRTTQSEASEGTQSPLDLSGSEDDESNSASESDESSALPSTVESETLATPSASYVQVFHQDLATPPPEQQQQLALPPQQ